MQLSFWKKLPHLSSHRTRLVATVAAVQAAFLLGAGALLWFVTAGDHASERGRRAEAIARSVQAFLDGDSLVGLTQAHPDAGAFRTWNDAPGELHRMREPLVGIAQSNGLAGTISLLVLKPELRDALSAQPEAPHTSALEVLVTTAERPDWRASDDYLPEMAGSFEEEGGASLVAGGTVQAFAPILDAWGKPVGLVRVEDSVRRPWWITGLLITLFVGVALLALYTTVRITNRLVGRMLGSFERLGQIAERLSRGDMRHAIEAGDASPEAVGIAASLERLRLSVRSRIEESEVLLEGSREATLRSEQRVQKEARETSEGARELRESLDDIVEFLLRLAKTPLHEKQRAAVEQAAERGRSTLLGLDRLIHRAPDAAASTKRFSAQSVVQEALNAVQIGAQTKGVGLRVFFPASIPNVLLGDPGGLRTALDHLIDNALRHTEHGTVTLRVSPVASSGDACCLRFEVADTGAGMDPEQREKLLAALGSGDLPAGRGLSIVKSIADAHGGGVGFESQRGSGSRFWFTARFQSPVQAAAA